MSNKPSKKYHFGEEADLRIAQLETALAQEKSARIHEKTKLERELEAMQELLQKNRTPDAAFETQLRRRVKRLERDLVYTAAKLSHAQRKAASFWIEKVAIENRTTYSPFVTHRGAWLAATLVTLSLLVWASQIAI